MQNIDSSRNLSTVVFLFPLSERERNLSNIWSCGGRKAPNALGRIFIRILNAPLFNLKTTVRGALTIQMINHLALRASSLAFINWGDLSFEYILNSGNVSDRLVVVIKIYFFKAQPHLESGEKQRETQTPYPYLVLELDQEIQPTLVQNLIRWGVLMKVFKVQKDEHFFKQRGQWREEDFTIAKTNEPLFRHVLRSNSKMTSDDLSRSVTQLFEAVGAHTKSIL